MTSIQPKPTFRITRARTSSDFEKAFELISAYGDFLKSVMQVPDIEYSLSKVRELYGPPKGTLWIARVGTEAAGCVAMRPLDRPATCEMKRLFVSGKFRGLGIGKALIEWFIDEARAAGYKTVRLDTMETMEKARALYEELGFKYIEQYTKPVSACSVFMEKTDL